MDIEREYAREGKIVVTSAAPWRFKEAIPLIIPEINGQLLTSPLYKSARLIANPNCSTIQLLMSLYPIAKQVGVCRLDVATYQAVSGAGYPAQEELVQQTAALLNLSGIVAAV